MKKSAWVLSRESEWMLRRVQSAGLDNIRSTRLFACACGRLAWDQLSDEVGRPSIELSERFADGRAGWADLQAERIRLGRHPYPIEGPARAIRQLAYESLMIFDFSLGSAQRVAMLVREIAGHSGKPDLEPAQCGLIREIFANPLEPQAIDPSWLTPRVVDLAWTIHERSAFDEMPMLGDALEEAGCSIPGILDHCRGDHKHARGCWVLNASIAADMSHYRPPDYPRST